MDKGSFDAFDRFDHVADFLGNGVGIERGEVGIDPRGELDVLDLGCGPAQASVVMRDHGFTVDPVDASPGMVKLANETHDIHARLATFDDLDAVETYDGVWANFSLLHARREQVPLHVSAIHRALKPEGIFHIGMKTGEGERRDHLGRRYSFFSEAALRGMLEASGFTVLAASTGRDKGLAGSVDPWVTLLSRRI